MIDKLDRGTCFTWDLRGKENSVFKIIDIDNRSHPGECQILEVQYKGDNLKLETSWRLKSGIKAMGEEIPDFQFNESLKHVFDYYKSL